MSKSIEFVDQGNLIALHLTRKSYPSKCYSQTFLNISVTRPNEENPFLDVDIGDQFSFMHFENITQFFNSLRGLKKKNQQAVRMISSSEVAFTFDGGSGIDQEVISLNTVRMVKEKELEEVTRSVNFPYLNFRTKKMIGKIEKGVEKAIKTAVNKKKIEEKKPKGLPPGCEVVFTLSDQWYSLNELHPYQIIPISLEDIQEKQLKLKVTKLKFDKIIVGLQYTLRNPEVEQIEGKNNFRRVCQFRRSMDSTLRIEEGQHIALSLEDGQLVVRNDNTNDGKMFSDSAVNDERDWSFKVVVSLIDL